MDRIDGMQAFVRVARLGSFAAAARELNLSTSSISRMVSQLEAHLGTSLLHRTTRRLDLTEPGRAYLDRAEALLADLEELERNVTGEHDHPAGRVRMTAGVSFAHEQLGPLLPVFLERHPGVDIELMLTDRHIDLVGENVDLALRLGRLPDSTHVARRIAPCRHVVACAPSYLKEHSLVRDADELHDHRCIIDTNQPRQWRLTDRSGSEVAVEVEGPLRVNSAHTSCDAALAGLGLAYLPTFVAGPHLARGSLVQATRGLEAATLGVFAVYPHNRYLRAAVRALVDFFVEQWSPVPPWDVPAHPELRAAREVPAGRRPKRRA